MKLSDSEWTVMNVVWELTSASARDVHERLEPKTPWAYTTVKTMLDRLVAKGALVSRRRANRLLFEPRLTGPQARRWAVRALIEAAFDGEPVSLIQHVLAHGSLSARDRDQVADIFAESRR